MPLWQRLVIAGVVMLATIVVARLIDRRIARKADFAEALNNLGGLLLAKGDAPRAADQLELAVKARPDYAEAQYNLGVARDAQGKKPEAVAAYKEAVRLRPDHFESWLNLGEACYKAGRDSEAVARAPARVGPAERRSGGLCDSRLGNRPPRREAGRVADALFADRRNIALGERPRSRGLGAGGWGWGRKKGRFRRRGDRGFASANTQTEQ